jgi:threonine dehydrogenase-like Zn-dependent dehydrogenase
MRPGDNVVVSGCGSIGLSVIQAAKLGGPNNLICFDPLESKRKLALECGADYAFDPSNEQDLEKAKAILSHIPGAQVCYEAAGHPASVQTCLDLCMSSGQVMMIGNDGRPYELVTAAVGCRQIDMNFSFVYTKEEILMLFDLIGKGRIDTKPYSLFKAPLDDAIKMLDALADGEIEYARVLLMPHGEV